jgi:hypothetical protein
MILGLVVASCAAHQPGPVPLIDAPGFWKGLWHGFIAPITFFVSLFSGDVRIYAFPNAGRWYDSGFIVGISGFSGGVFAGSRRRDHSWFEKAITQRESLGRDIGPRRSSDHAPRDGGSPGGGLSLVGWR